MTLSGVTPYPDRAVWEGLAPDQEDEWNNYSNTYWFSEPGIDQAYIDNSRGSRRDLHLNPCAADTLDLRIDLSLTPKRLDLPCLELVETIPYGESQVYLYRTVEP